MNRQEIASGMPRFAKKSLGLLAVALSCLASMAASVEAGHFGKEKLEGVVKGGTGSGELSGYEVSLYASYSSGIPFKRLLGTDTTDGSGKFKIRYKLPPGSWGDKKPVLYLLAEYGNKMLASAIGDNDDVVVNELTTVAIGTAFAQFIDGRKISGNKYGMLNAVKIAANMANPETGAIGDVLNEGPNGADTTTRPTFYSLANIVAACIDDSNNCDDLFDYATPKGGSAPTTVLQAVANMTKFPSHVTITDFDGLFELSDPDNQVYGPALTSAPTSWLLFIKFTGAMGPDAAEYKATNLISGPGQINFDERGFAWINDNYNPSDFDPSDPLDFFPDPPSQIRIGCAGARLLKFYPWGEKFPGTPYFGGGLSGAGYGIATDPRHKIWVGNFGFESPNCIVPPLIPPPGQKIPATHDSVSLFRPNGTSVAGPDGFTKGDIWWPQGMASDKKGNIWIGNCGNDTVTLIPRGNPWKARNFELPGGLAATTGNTKPDMVGSKFGTPRPVLKPFGLALDLKGRAWVVGNSVGYNGDPEDVFNGGLYRVSKDGVIDTIILPEDERLSFPMGIASDSKGNMWVSNSDKVFVPCVTPFTTNQGEVLGPSVTFVPADITVGTEAQIFGALGSEGGTGGLTIPWGNFVDGNDTLWVFNFGVLPFETTGDEPEQWKDTPLSHFCGADTDKCPAGLRLGDAISPEEGYLTNALDRVTGGGVAPSGAIWILNNWKKTGPYNPVYIRNPGGNSFVIVPGAAAPVKTPAFGPPEGFGNDHKHFAFAFFFFLPFFPWFL